MRAILQADLSSGRRWLGSELANTVRADMAGLLPIIHAANLAPDRPQCSNAKEPLIGHIGYKHPGLREQRGPRPMEGCKLGQPDQADYDLDEKDIHRQAAD